jgi:hypothetical protein
MRKTIRPSEAGHNRSRKSASGLQFQEKKNRLRESRGRCLPLRRIAFTWAPSSRSRACDRSSSPAGSARCWRSRSSRRSPRSRGTPVGRRFLVCEMTQADASLIFATAKGPSAGHRPARDLLFPVAILVIPAAGYPRGASQFWAGSPGSPASGRGSSRAPPTRPREPAHPRPAAPRGAPGRPAAPAGRFPRRTCRPASST